MIETSTVLLASLVTTSTTKGLILIVVPTDVPFKTQFIPQLTTDIMLVIPWTILIVPNPLALNQSYFEAFDSKSYVIYTRF